MMMVVVLVVMIRNSSVGDCDYNDSSGFLSVFPEGSQHGGGKRRKAPMRMKKKKSYFSMMAKQACP